MMSLSRRTWVLCLCLAAFALASGCQNDAGNDPSPPPGPPVAGKSSPEIKRIMTRLAKGPGSLTPMLGNELKAEPLAWETIQGQTKEYAELAAEMAKYDPPKGSKESWAKQAGEYSASALELDKAARAKDKDAAIEAHGRLANSCNACHREHRAMGPGMGGPGGGRGMGPPPGGPGGPGPGGPPPK